MRRIAHRLHTPVTPFVARVVVADVVQRLRPQVERRALEASALLVMSLGEATVRLAIFVEPAEGRAMLEGYKRIGLKELLGE